MNFKKNYKIISTVMTCLVILVVIGANLIVGILGDKVNLNVDLTKSQIISLSDLTKQTLENLDEEVRILSLIPEDFQDAYGVAESMDLILNKYTKESNKVTYKRVNTNKEPTIFQKYKDENGNDATEFSIIFETDKTYKVVDVANVASIANEVVLFGGEQMFTSAIEYVTTGEKPIIYVVEGHDEAGTAEFVKGVFSGQSFEIKSLNLMNNDVPEDASIVMILSPNGDFLAEELDALDKYLDNGGNAIIAGSNKPEIENKNLSEFYGEYGVEYLNAYVVEESAKNYFNNSPLCLIPTIENHAITQAVANQRIATIYSQAMDTQSAKNVENQTILSSTPKSYLKYDKDDIDYVVGDEKGPFVLANLSTKTSDSGKKSEILFLSNSYYMHSLFLSDSGFANKDFITNSVKYLSGSTSLLSIGPKDLTPATIAIDAREANVLSILVILVIPLVIIIFGFVVWIRRKNL